VSGEQSCFNSRSPSPCTGMPQTLCFGRDPPGLSYLKLGDNVMGFLQIWECQRLEDIYRSL